MAVTKQLLVRGNMQLQFAFTSFGGKCCIEFSEC